MIVLSSCSLSFIDLDSQSLHILVRFSCLFRLPFESLGLVSWKPKINFYKYMRNTFYVKNIWSVRTGPVCFIV